VTSETDFHAALDADPNDWQTLLVFSDWLRDRDDPRADGYAALARRGRRPGRHDLNKTHGANWEGTWFAWAKLGTANRIGGPVTEADIDALFADWYDLLKGANQLPTWDSQAWAYFRTRSAALDVAARAFTDLPAARRAALLAP